MLNFLDCRIYWQWIGIDEEVRVEGDPLIWSCYYSFWYGLSLSLCFLKSVASRDSFSLNLLRKLMQTDFPSISIGCFLPGGGRPLWGGPQHKTMGPFAQLFWTQKPDIFLFLLLKTHPTGDPCFLCSSHYMELAAMVISGHGGMRRWR